MPLLNDRRPFLKSALGVSAAPLVAQDRSKQWDEYEPGNLKLAHRVTASSVSDDDLLFLKQIGLRWVRLEFGEADLSLDQLHAFKDRFARFGLRIYSGVHYSYRSTRVQLGQPGRDQDIETFCRFLRNIGQ